MPSANELPLLLDTHVWFWMLEGEEGVLAASAIEAIEAGAGAGGILISAISIWELALLDQRGRLRFRTDIEDWVSGGLSSPGTRLAELSAKILIESTRLPGTLHRDPADRMLVATARHMGARLVTRDRAILRYAGGGHVGVLDANP